MTNTLSNEVKENLIQTAAEMAPKAYCPYSQFQVGAAILAEDNKIYTGVNVENQSYGISICAERTAAVKMVSEGARGIKAVAVSTGVGASPCGACRQFLNEFIMKDLKDFPIFIHNSKTNQVVETSMNAILPQACEIKDVLTNKE